MFLVLLTKFHHVVTVCPFFYFKLCSSF